MNYHVLKIEFSVCLQPLGHVRAFKEIKLQLPSRAFFMFPLNWVQK